MTYRISISRQQLNAFVTLILSLFFSLPIFYFIKHNIRYLLFIFQLGFIILLNLFINSEKKIMSNFDFRSKLNSHYLVAHIPFILSIILLVLVVLKSDLLLLRLPLSIFSPIILGSSLLRILNFSYKYNEIETGVISLIVGIGVQALLMSFIIQSSLDKGLILLSACTILSGFTIRKEKKAKPWSSKKEKLISLYGILLLCWVALFFIIIIAITYPGMSLLPGHDIIRHFAWTIQLLSEPRLYSQPYLWYHCHLAVINVLSNAQREIFQTSLAFLSIIIIFSFYIMVKIYTESVDKKIPVISTVLWSVFSGFGWIYFLKSNINNSYHNLNHSQLLQYLHNATYWDIGYGEATWLWLWYRPYTLGVTLFFVLMYLLRRVDLPRRTFILLFSFVILMLFMFHPPEIFLFSLLLIILTINYSESKLRLKDAAISSLLGILLSIIYIFGYQFLYNMSPPYPIIFCAFMTLLFFTSLIVALIKEHILKQVNLHIKLSEKIYRYISDIALIFWVSLFISFFINKKASIESNLFYLQKVPPEFYPTLIGISGMLAFIGMRLTIKNNKDTNINIISTLFIFSMFLGRMFTYINANYMATPLYERRVIPICYSASAILAGVFIVNLFRRLQSRKIASTVLISFIVFSGFSSTALTMEFWLYPIMNGKYTDDEIKCINLLSDIADPNSNLLTVTWRSTTVAEYVPLNWRIFNFGRHVWPSKTPELPLNALSSTGAPAFIYLSQCDRAQLKNISSLDGYITEHLLKISPLILNSSNNLIYEVPKLAPPTDMSNVVLVLPEENESSVYMTFYLLSLAGYNYTTSLVSDIQTISKAKVIIAPNDSVALKILALSKYLNLNSKKLILLNINGSFVSEITSKYFTNIPFTLQTYFEELFNTTCIDFSARASADEKRKNYSELGNTVRSKIGDLSIYNYKGEDLISQSRTAAFREGFLKGNITIKCDSAFFSFDPDVDIRCLVDGKKTYITNVDSIVPINTKNITINSTSVRLSGYKGFYSKIMTNASSIGFYGNSTLVINLKDESKIFIKGNSVEMKVSHTTTIVRKPFLAVTGYGTFTDFYAYKELYSLIPSLGQDVEFKGQYDFTILYGDVYLVITNVNYQKEHECFNLFHYKRLNFKGLLLSLPYFIILLTAYLIFILMKNVGVIKIRNKTRAQKVGEV